MTKLGLCSAYAGSVSNICLVVPTKAARMRAGWGFPPDLCVLDWGGTDEARAGVRSSVAPPARSCDLRPGRPRGRRRAPHRERRAVCGEGLRQGGGGRGELGGGPLGPLWGGSALSALSPPERRRRNAGGGSVGGAAGRIGAPLGGCAARARSKAVGRWIAAPVAWPERFGRRLPLRTSDVLAS